MDNDDMICVKCKKEIPEDAVFCLYCGRRQEPAPRKALKRANGTGTVYKLSGRRRRPWVASKGKTIIGYYETKTAALEALDKLAGRTIDERYNMTFAEVYTAWSAEHFPSVSSAVAQAFRASYSVFKNLHEKKYRDLRTSDYQPIFDELGKSRATAAKHKQLLNQMNLWALREEVVSQNFAQFIRLPAEEKKEKEIFTEEEIAKLTADGSETAQIVLMLIGTGMRINELFTLPLSDYHETYCIGGEKTEAGKNRIIPIRTEARQHFAHFAATATGDLLISGYAGSHDRNNFRNRDYKRLLEWLEIPYKTPHATRHTYASRAAAAGMRPEVLQKILGHADYSTTANIYVHADIDELVSAVECL